MSSSKILIGNFTILEKDWRNTLFFSLPQKFDSPNILKSAPLLIHLLVQMRFAPYLHEKLYIRKHQRNISTLGKFPFIWNF